MHRVRISWLSIGAENIPNKKKRFFPFYFVSHPNELWSLVSICWLSLVVISNIFLHFDASTPGDFYYIALNSTIPKRCQLFNSQPFAVVLFVVHSKWDGSEMTKSLKIWSIGWQWTQQIKQIKKQRGSSFVTNKWKQMIVGICCDSKDQVGGCIGKYCRMYWCFN